jgi:CHAT domain-containing protein/Tfp pilus assembly protein PilF
MSQRIKPFLKGGIIVLLLYALSSSLNTVFASHHQQRMTQDEFNSDLRKAVDLKDDILAETLIHDNRLLVKAFVDGMIRESLSLELKGKISGAKQARASADKAAGIFESLYGEKSLTIAVNYLAVWSKNQKAEKLIADSLYAAGTKIRGNEKDRDKAIEYYKKAINLYRQIGDERGEAEILGGFGLIYSSFDNETSLDYYRQALVKREKVDDRLLIGNTRSSMGSTYYSPLKDYPSALKYLTKAEEIRIEIGDSAKLGQTVLVLASVYEHLGQFEKAIEYYKRSYELNNKSGDMDRVAQALLNTGIILNGLGRYTEALEYIDSSLNISKTHNNLTAAGDALNQLGLVYYKLGDYKAALDRYMEVIKIATEQNDSWGLAGAYNNLGILLQNSGRAEKSIEYYENALKIYEELGERESVIIILNNLGTLSFDIKDYTEAENYQKRGLEISREVQSIGQEANFLLNLANDQIYLGKNIEAIANYNESLKLARELNNPDLLWRIKAGTAEYYERRGEFEKAVQLNDTVIKILDGLRNSIQSDEFKASFLAGERYAFEDIISMLEKLHQKDESKSYDDLAFRYAEQCKARVLLDLLSESSTNADATSSLQMSIGDVMKMCPDKKIVFLEYSVGDSSSCLWVITSTDHHLFKIPPKKEIKENIETLRFALQDPSADNMKFFASSSSALYEKLIKPAEPYLPKNSRIIIIPDGILNYLPFEVLLTDNKVVKTTNGYSDLPYLIKKHALSYVQSASVLKSILDGKQEINRSKTIEKKIIAFGDPVYDGETGISNQKGNIYKRLEYSGKEIENIAALFKPEDKEIFLRDNASEYNLKKEGELTKFRYLHFATHGYINEASPDLSSLVLTHAENSNEDGFLQTNEIFKLKLKADLVVLSACQTGMGKMINGEGIVGLTRAFMYAGSSSVLVSLWNVSDISTSILMGEFYKNLVKNKLSETDALRNAQLNLINNKKFAHPFFWAPFVLIGDWN